MDRYNSACLINDTESIIGEAYTSSTFFGPAMFYKTVFCAKRDWFLCKRFAKECEKIDEYHILMLMRYGKKYHSPIEKYNSMSLEELKQALVEYRTSVVNTAKSIYVKRYSIHAKKKRSDEERAFTLYSRSSRLRNEDKPFSDLYEVYKTWLEGMKETVESYRLQKTKGSYPERVMASLLDLLNVNYEREKVFSWSHVQNSGDDSLNGIKRYDFYIPSLSTIIEMHGEQHYSGSFEKIGGRTLLQEQENDSIKEKLAKDNGIQHYIVINASISDIKYIRDSIKDNQDFTELLDIQDINWKDVHAGTQTKIDADVEFPLFEESYKEYCEWLAIIQKCLTEADYKVRSSEKTRQQKSISIKLRESILEAHPSSGGLYPHELAVLKEATQYVYPYELNNYPKWWLYRYDIIDVSEILEELKVKGFLQLDDLYSCVKNATVAFLKKMLIENNLPAHGQKSELVKRVIQNIEQSYLENAFKYRHLKLTELGEKEVAENQYLFITINHGYSIWELNKIHFTYPNDDIETALSKYHKSLMQSNEQRNQKRKEDEALKVEKKNKSIWKRFAKIIFSRK